MPPVYSIVLWKPMGPCMPALPSKWPNTTILLICITILTGLINRIFLSGLQLSVSKSLVSTHSLTSFRFSYSGFLVCSICISLERGFTTGRQRSVYFPCFFVVEIPVASLPYHRVPTFCFAQCRLLGQQARIKRHSFFHHGTASIADCFIACHG